MRGASITNCLILRPMLRASTILYMRKTFLRQTIGGMPLSTRVGPDAWTGAASYRRLGGSEATPSLFFLIIKDLWWQACDVNHGGEFSEDGRRESRRGKIRRKWVLASRIQ